MPTTAPDARSSAAPEELASNLRVAVMRLRRRLANERHPDNDLGIGVMAVLGCLLHHGELSVGELAGFERVQPPSMTRAVRKLEEKGYVTRRPHDGDRRQVLVSLTPQGRALLLDDRRRREEWLARRLRDLDSDDRALLRAAVPLLDRLAHED